MTTAVIFVPATHFELYASQCLTYCAARGYEVAGIVTGTWSSAISVLASRTATVLVVARAEHLDPDREPRLEIVAQADAGPVHQRTRMVRRNAAK